MEEGLCCLLPRVYSFGSFLLNTGSLYLVSRMEYDAWHTCLWPRAFISSTHLALLLACRVLLVKVCLQCFVRPCSFNSEDSRFWPNLPSKGNFVPGITRESSGGVSVLIRRSLMVSYESVLCFLGGTSLIVSVYLVVRGAFFIELS